jgi:hypothetical protein
VQVDPIKPTLKAPGYECLNIKWHDMLSSFAFILNLRRYTWVISVGALDMVNFGARDTVPAKFEAGAYTRPLFGST